MSHCKARWGTSISYLSSSLPTIFWPHETSHPLILLPFHHTLPPWCLLSPPYWACTPYSVIVITPLCMPQLNALLTSAYLLGKTPNLVKFTSLPALHLQLNCGWRKIQNHTICSHFKFMTNSHKWILGVAWQPNYFPRHSLSNSCGRPRHIYSSLLKPLTPLPPFSLSVSDLVSYFIEKISEQKIKRTSQSSHNQICYIGKGVFST